MSDVIHAFSNDSGVPPDLDAWFDRKFEEHMAKREASHVPEMTIISTKGSLDMAYPPFILASTAAALGWKVSAFFTFYGLSLLKKDLDLRRTWTSR